MAEIVPFDSAAAMTAVGTTTRRQFFRRAGALGAIEAVVSFG